MRIWFTMLLPLICRGQLIVTASDGVITTTLASNSAYQVAQTETGETRTLTVRITNTGASNESITRFSVDGAGFTMQTPALPFVIAPNRFIEATLRFSGAAAASYSANLQVNNISVLLFVSVVAGPVLTTAANCTFDFGIVTRGVPLRCDMDLRNPSSQPLSISNLFVTGPGFSLGGVPGVPFTIAAGQTVSFAVALTAQGVGTVSGTLRVQSRDYALSATSVNGPLPQPIIEFDSTAAASGQQRRLTMQLPLAAPYTATGFLDIALQPDAILALDDPAVLFLPSGSRHIPFAVEQGKTAVMIDGQSFATFQTGSTAGRIRFTLGGIAGGFSSDPSVIVIIPAAVVALDGVTATRFPDRLEVVFAGFDNTQSTGAMSFSFFDSAGGIYGAAIPADFTSAFRGYFAANAGGTFRARIQFPVTGEGTVITGVEAEVRNSAGTVRTQRLSF